MTLEGRGYLKLLNFIGYLQCIVSGKLTEASWFLNGASDGRGCMVLQGFWFLKILLLSLR